MPRTLDAGPKAGLPTGCYKMFLARKPLSPLYGPAQHPTPAVCFSALLCQRGHLLSGQNLSFPLTFNGEVSFLKGLLAGVLSPPSWKPLSCWQQTLLGCVPGPRASSFLSTLVCLFNKREFMCVNVYLNVCVPHARLLPLEASRGRRNPKAELEYSVCEQPGFHVLFLK